MGFDIVAPEFECEDVAETRATLARIDAGEGTMPGEVLGAILDDGLHPIAAWRRCRCLSQAELARRSGLSQVWLSRIENGGGHGFGCDPAQAGVGAGGCGSSVCLQRSTSRKKYDENTK